MTSCGGTFSVIVRRSTLTIRSMIGIRRKTPGPFGSGSRRPRRKMTPRSYSRATLIAAVRKRMTRTATAATTISAVTTWILRDRLALGLVLHRKCEAIDTDDADLVAGSERPLV